MVADIAGSNLNCGCFVPVPTQRVIPGLAWGQYQRKAEE